MESKVFMKALLKSLFPFLFPKDPRAFKMHYEVPVGGDMENVAKILRALGYQDLRDKGSKILFSKDFQFTYKADATVTTKLSVDVTAVSVNQASHLRFKLRESKGFPDVQSFAFKEASEFHKLYSAMDWQD